MPSSIFELTSDSAVVERLASKKTLVAAANEATLLTAAQSIESIITMTPSTGRAITTATGPEIIAELGVAEVGTCFEVTIVNLAGSTAVITFTGSATGVTVSGLATVAHGTSATFIGRVASASTVVYYRAANG
jgi:hypothetical protein